MGKLRKTAAWAYDFLFCWLITGGIVCDELFWHQLLGFGSQARSECSASLGHALVKRAGEIGLPEWLHEFLLELPGFALFIAPPLLLSTAATCCAWRFFRNSPGRWMFCGAPAASALRRAGRIGIGIGGLFVILIAWMIVVLTFLDPI